MEKLKGIDITVEGTWHDFIVNMTSKLIPSSAIKPVEEKKGFTFS